MQKTLTLLAIFGCVVSAQTTIDLGRQSRNIDFSESSSTKSFKTGTSLPATCSIGETYLRLDGPAGQNFYACLSNNVWTPQGSGAGESGGTTIASFDWTRISSTSAQLSQGSFRFGSKVTNLTGTANVTLQGSLSGTIWIYANAAGSVVLAHNLGVGNLSVSGTGFVIDALGNGFPAGAIPVYQCVVTTGSLPVSCTDMRAALSATNLIAGTSGALSVDCASGNNCTVDITPAAVPVLTAGNTFTGLNTFNQLRLPAGPSPDPLQCASASDAGKIWAQTSAASGRQLYLCEGTNGWKAQGDLPNISTPLNLGYISTVSPSEMLAPQATVGSGNEVRLALVAVPNQVRLARLALSIATASAGGKVRVGIYKTNGTLIAQTSALDTGSAVVRSSTFTPVILDPGYYYFAWSLDNTTATLAGTATGSLNGLFNHVSASPGQGTCSETLTASGLPNTCTIVAMPDTSAFPMIAIVGSAQ